MQEASQGNKKAYKDLYSYAGSGNAEAQYYLALYYKETNGSGADELCEMLSYDGKHTKVNVYIGLNNKEAIKTDYKSFRCSRKEWSLTGGATYLPHFSGAKHLTDGTFWLCPVTLFVLGEYPDTMWVEPLELSGGKMNKLGLRP